MSFFRSQQMKYYNLVIPRESAWEVMNQLGDLECLHFVDYDPSLPMINRPFANYIKRCDDTLSKLYLIIRYMEKFQKKINSCNDITRLMDHYKEQLKNRDKPSHTYFEEVEQEVEQRSAQIGEQINNLENILEKQNELHENRQVLQKCHDLLGINFFSSFKSNDDQKQMGDAVSFDQIVGVISKEDETRFKRIVFRITKGNVWMNIIAIEENHQQYQKQNLRSIFIIVFPGNSDSKNVYNKIIKVAESFGSRRYDMPSGSDTYEKQLSQIDSQLSESTHLAQLSKQSIDSLLEAFRKSEKQGCSWIESLRLYVVREKCLYTNLNYLRMQGSVFCGNFWLPEGKEQSVEVALRSIRQRGGDIMPFGQFQESKPLYSKPPTYFNLNDFTFPFQEIVNTYGIPRYQEVNPALFTVTTFPFLFGVMFADIGHGFILFMAGLFLVIQSEKITSESSFKVMVPARYLILLMGFFALYNGVIYNDFLSLPLNLFGSCFALKGESWERQDGCIYPFGIDPVWAVSENSLTFINPYKMKLSVIIGVTHMLFGIIMKGANSVYFRNMIDFFCEFIPQIVFLICTFGFMDFLIVYKWLHEFASPYNKLTNEPPSIITLLINMVLTPFADPDPSLFDPSLEKNIGMILLVTAIIMVPIMLLPKPFLVRANHPPRYQSAKVDDASKPLISNSVKNDEEQKDQDQFGKDLLKMALGQRESVKQEGDEQHDFSEMFVHQVIETIEFVLGSISNTASYLRLWALSLAHGQLAEVFFNMALASFIKQSGFIGTIGMIIAFSIFAMVTFGVLLMMDVMECFLHALRLHWVEFQNKFYKADGYLFVKFSYRKVISDHLSFEQ